TRPLRSPTCSATASASSPHKVTSTHKVSPASSHCWASRLNLRGVSATRAFSTALPDCVNRSSGGAARLPVRTMLLVMSCCLSFEFKPVHCRAVFHPRPVPTGAETVGHVTATHPVVAPPLHERDGLGLVIPVGCEADTDLGPAELLRGAA